MKKLVLILTMVTAFTFVNGQGRTVDLAVTSIAKPDRIPNGGPIDLSFTVKNEGTDMLKIGDSIFYQIVVPNYSLVLPGGGAYLLSILTKDIPSGDSVTIILKANLNVNWNPSSKNNFCIGALAMNRATDSIKLETSATLGNNSLCRLTQFGDWNTGIDASSISQGINVYPNPAHGQFNISYTTEKSSDVTIRLMDITGREVMPVVKQRQQAGANVEQINTENLAPGVYIYQLNIDGNSQTGKITVE